MARSCILSRRSAVPLRKQFYALKADVVPVSAVLGAGVAQPDDHLQPAHESAHPKPKRRATTAGTLRCLAVRAWIPHVRSQQRYTQRASNRTSATPTRTGFLPANKAAKPMKRAALMRTPLKNWVRRRSKANDSPSWSRQAVAPATVWTAVPARQASGVAVGSSRCRAGRTAGITAAAAAASASVRRCIPFHLRLRHLADHRRRLRRRREGRCRRRRLRRRRSRAAARLQRLVDAHVRR